VRAVVREGPVLCWRGQGQVPSQTPAVWISAHTAAVWASRRGDEPVEAGHRVREAGGAEERKGEEDEDEVVEEVEEEEVVVVKGESMGGRECRTARQAWRST
jgi:hypothetical protein